MSRLELVRAFKTGDHKGRPYEARAESTDGFQRISSWGTGLSRPALDFDAFKTGDHKGRPYGARAESTGGFQRIPSWGTGLSRRALDLSVHSRRATTRVAPTGPCRVHRWVSTHSLVGDGLVASRLGFVRAFKAGDHKGRPYGARAESADGFQRIPSWGTGLFRPDSNSSVHSRRATTRVAPTGPVPSPPVGFNAFPRGGRACPRQTESNNLI